GGLGIEVTMEDGLIKVVAPIDDTPAAKAGILAGDIITKLDDEPVQGLTLSQAVTKMRGAINSKIRLSIVRKGQDKPIEVTLTRETIHVRSVRFHPEGDDVGYIRITQFNEKTSEGLQRAVSELSKQVPAEKLKGYVLDLRNNPGGLLDQAIAVSNAFIERGEIVSTRGRNPDESQRFYANASRGDLLKGRRRPGPSPTYRPIRRTTRRSRWPTTFCAAPSSTRISRSIRRPACRTDPPFIPEGSCTGPSPPFVAASVAS